MGDQTSALDPGDLQPPPSAHGLNSNMRPVQPIFGGVSTIYLIVTRGPSWRDAIRVNRVAEKDVYSIGFAENWILLVAVCIILTGHVYQMIDCG